MSKFYATLSGNTYPPYAELGISRKALPPLSWNGRLSKNRNSNITHWVMSRLMVITIQMWRGVIYGRPM